jgi:HK97 family phage prohead protease
VREYQKKTIEGKAIDVDKKGYVKVAFSRVNFKDFDNDVIMPEAFKKTLKEQGPEGAGLIYHLTNHSWKWNSSFIALPTKMYLSGEYLISESEIDLKTNPHGAFMHARYMNGEVKQHSIGFQSINSKRKSDYNEITELKLMEGSAVLWGANIYTETIEAKYLANPNFLLEEIAEASEEFKKYLKTGLNTEETLFFGRNLEQLHSIANKLFSPQPETQNITKPSPDTLPTTELLELIEQFKI